MSQTLLAHSRHTNLPMDRQAIRQTQQFFIFPWLLAAVVVPHGSPPMSSGNHAHALPHRLHPDTLSKGKAYCLLPKCRKKNYVWTTPRPNDYQLNRELHSTLPQLLAESD